MGNGSTNEICISRNMNRKLPFLRFRAANPGRIILGRFSLHTGGDLYTKKSFQNMHTEYEIISKDNL